MKLFMMTNALTCLAIGAQAAPGLKEFEIPGERVLEAHVMYPTNDTTEMTAFGGNAVWHTTDVIVGAEPKLGKMPLVVISHGMFGNRFNQVWLGHALADEGYIVVAANHPGNSTWNRDPETSGHIWERAGDLSTMIDHMLDDSEWSARIDTDAIFAIGHSLGGYGVLNAAGAKFDTSLFTQACLTGNRPFACGPYEVLGVSVQDAIFLEADMTDPRLAGVVSLDPGGTFGFSSESLEAIETPVLLISAKRAPMQIDPTYESDRVAEFGADIVTYLPMEDAGHFDFMGVCTDQALKVLAEEEPDDLYVCELGTDARRAIQAHTVKAMLKFFATQN